MEERTLTRGESNYLTERALIIVGGVQQHCRMQDLIALILT